MCKVNSASGELNRIMELEIEENEDLNNQRTEISAEKWENIFERLNSVNSETHELVIDKAGAYSIVRTFIGDY